MAEFVPEGGKCGDCGYLSNQGHFCPHCGIRFGVEREGRTMAVGSGKYDHLCGAARVAANASGVVLIVLGGEFGHGCSIQVEIEDLLAVPGLLREIASQIDAELVAGAKH